MQDENKLKSLNNLVGKEWMYRQEIVRVKNWMFNDEQTVITMALEGKGYIKFNSSELGAKLKEFLPVSSSEKKQAIVKVAETDKELQLSFGLESNVFNDAKAIIIDTIQKVRVDKEYLPQAQAINQGVLALMDIMKTEVLVAKFCNGAK